MLTSARGRAGALLLAAAVVAPSAAEDWTRFRGPNGTGVTDATNLPVEFGPERNVAWKTPLPPGHSSPVVASDRIFLTAHDGTRLLVIALDREDGRVLWQREVRRRQEGRVQNVNGPASPSPVTDGRNVYAFFQDFGLVSFAGDGALRWELPLGPFSVFYGFGASPMLADGLVILPVDQDVGSYLIGVDQDSGRVRWKTERPEVISGYSTPTLYVPKAGPKQVLIPESFQLSAYSVEDGRRVFWVRGLACEMKSVASYDEDSLYVNGWGFPQNQPGQQVATTSFEDGLAKYDRDKDGRVAAAELAGIERGSGDAMGLMLKNAFQAFDAGRDGQLDAKDWSLFRAMMAAENGLLAIRLGGEGDRTDGAVRWKYQRPVPQVPSTLLYKGVLYMVNDSGILISFDPKDGKVLKQGRLQGAIDKYFASPVAADGRVYLVSQDGTVSVVAAKADWEVVAVNKLDDEVFATPVLLDGRVLVRTKSALYCFGRKG